MFLEKKSKKTYLNLYKKLLLIRIVEEKIVSEYSKNLMRCPVHLSIGQEACAVGVCGALSLSDKVFSTHRCHAHYIAKEGNIYKMVAEIYGKEDGCCNGRGGSMHLFDKTKNFISSIPIVSSGIPLSVGSSLNDKLNNKKSITCSFFGDGSLEEGVFHESLNFASINNLKNLFVCENNLFSVYTDIKLRQPNRSFKKLAEAHKVDYYEMDGSNAIEIYLKVLKLKKLIIKRSKPLLLVLNTFRYREHCGPNIDDHLGYRKNSYIKSWLKKDPINITFKNLLKNHIIDESKNDILIENIKKNINSIFLKAEKAKLPKSKDVKKFVYQN